MSDNLEKQFTENQNGHGGARAGAGRPIGAVNKTTSEIRALAGAWGPAAVEKAAKMAGLVLDDQGSPIGQAESETVRFAAIEMLLNRGFGKPATIVTGEDGKPPELTLSLNDKHGEARRVAFMLSKAFSRVGADANGR